MEKYYKFCNKLYKYYTKVGYGAGDEASTITLMIASFFLSIQIFSCLLIGLFIFGNNVYAFLNESILDKITFGHLKMQNLKLVGLVLWIITFIVHKIISKSYQKFSDFITLSSKDIMYIFLWGIGSFIFFLFSLACTSPHFNLWN